MSIKFEVPDIPSVVSKYRDPKGNKVFESLIKEYRSYGNDIVEDLERNPTPNNWIRFMVAERNLNALAPYIYSKGRIDEPCNYFVDDWNILPIFDKIDDYERWEEFGENRYDDEGYSQDYDAENLVEITHEAERAADGLMGFAHDLHRDLTGNNLRVHWGCHGCSTTLVTPEEKDKYIDTYFGSMRRFQFMYYGITFDEDSFSITPEVGYSESDVRAALKEMGRANIAELFDYTPERLRKEVDAAQAEFDKKMIEVARSYGGYGQTLIQYLGDDFTDYLTDNVHFMTTNKRDFWEKYENYRDGLRRNSFYYAGVDLAGAKIDTLAVPTTVIDNAPQAAYGILYDLKKINQEFHGNPSIYLHSSLEGDIRHLMPWSDSDREIWPTLDRDKESLRDAIDKYICMMDIFEASGYAVSDNFRYRLLNLGTLIDYEPDTGLFEKDKESFEQTYDAWEVDFESAMDTLQSLANRRCASRRNIDFNLDKLEATARREIVLGSGEEYMKRDFEEEYPNKGREKVMKLVQDVQREVDEYRARIDYEMGW